VMKNVLVFSLGGGAGDRFAVELRWVREIFPMGPITPVPTAPPAIAGAVNFRGAIVPVMRTVAILRAAGVQLAEPAGRRGARAGDTCVLLDVDGTRAALAVDRINEVTTVTASLEDSAVFEDSQGARVRLLDPPGIIGAARRLVGEAVAGGHASRT
jgi:chemotaxis signal transduction protein